MKLTLSVGGGFTGLIQESSIDVDSLDESTREALLDYISRSEPAMPMNLNETWIWNDEKEVPIDCSKMNSELRELYDQMKEKLSFPEKPF
jgi:hypothetical protein